MNASVVRQNMTSVRSSHFKVLEMMLILEFFISMKAYLFWGINDMVHLLFYMLTVVVGYTYVLKKRMRLSRAAKFATLFYVIAFYWGTGLNLFGIIAALFPVLVVVPLLLVFNREESEDILKKLSMILAVIVGLGVIEYLINLAVPLPVFQKLKYVGIAESEFVYDNYIFMVKQEVVQLDHFHRFMSIFTEAGHLAVISCFLLHGNRYDFKKWYNIVLLIGIIVSLSLAGYVLLIMGMLFMSTGKNSKRIFGALIVLVTVGYLFGNFYNGGDNIVHEKIIERLEFDDEKGISGNNRVGANTELLFLSAVANGEIIRGYGVEFEEYVEAGYHGAGWQFFLLRKGVIGLIFVIFFYISMVLDSKNRMYALGLFAIYSAAFMAQADVFNFAWSILFICSYKAAPEVLKYIPSVSKRRNALSVTQKSLQAPSV